MIKHLLLANATLFDLVTFSWSRQLFEYILVWLFFFGSTQDQNQEKENLKVITLSIKKSSSTSNSSSVTLSKIKTKTLTSDNDFLTKGRFLWSWPLFLLSWAHFQRSGLHFSPRALFNFFHSPIFSIKIKTTLSLIKKTQKIKPHSFTKNQTPLPL